MIDPNGVGHDGFFQSAYRALRDQEGRIVGVVIVTLDLTEQVRARSALEVSRAEADGARRAAESANRAKDEFLAMLGHELRNPLAPIITALELMRLRDGTVATKERDIIERQARHMAGLVDDLLDVSRITQSKIELKPEVTELGGLISAAVETAAPLLEKRRHTLVIQVPPRTFYVDADRARLTQVFSNILTNAAKYTDDGGCITVEAEAKDGQIVIRFSDTGRGISPQILPHVFDLFSQEQQNLDRSQGGLGLGLAIVKSLVAMHRGTVTVHSDGVGHGSQFVVTLPAASRPADPTPPSGHAALAAMGTAGEPAETRPPGPRVIVVDDNRDAAAMVGEALGLMGYTTSIAHDAVEALALAEHGLPPAAAFLDIGLPVMDGYELARRLRALPGWHEVVLVAVTGYGQESDRTLSHEAGFDLHLVKPIGLVALRQALARVPVPAA